MVDELAIDLVPAQQVSEAMSLHVRWAFLGDAPVHHVIEPVDLVKTQDTWDSEKTLQIKQVPLMVRHEVVVYRRAERGVLHGTDLRLGE